MRILAWPGPIAILDRTRKSARDHIFRWKGRTVGRRGVKEYRAPEALVLIAADREHRPLVCPSCGSDHVERHPPRTADNTPAGKVTLHCPDCSRNAVYIDRGRTTDVTTGAPLHPDGP